MKLLIDSDAFCKLGIAGLLNDMAQQLGATLAESARLPALPYMLRRGKLRRTYGADHCDALLVVAEQVPAIPEASTDWLTGLAERDGVDPGEAQLLAVAAERSLFLVSGDKRALRAIKDVERLVVALGERVIVIEAALLSLCSDLGIEVIRLRVTPIQQTDTMLRVCFSGSSDPREGLRSYFENASADVHPLRLWRAK